VLALIDGPTLADRINSGPISLDEAFAISRQIIEALEYALDPNAVISRTSWIQIYEKTATKRSAILTSQLPVSRRAGADRSPTVFSNRLVHNAHRIEMRAIRSARTGVSRREVGEIPTRRARPKCYDRLSVVDMFGLLKPMAYQDDQLGTLTRSGCYWEGDCALPPQGTFKLRLSGDRKCPDATNLALARELSARFAAFLTEIQKGLFEHYQPYKEAATAGVLPKRSKAFPEINSAEAVWPHVLPLQVLIERLQGVPTIEIAFAVAWDEEHMVGARIQEWRLIELCGSV